MGVGAGLYMYDVVVRTFTFAISSTDELFSYSLLNAVLRSWFAIVSYLTDSAAAGHLQFLTSEANTKLTTFLVDVLLCFSRSQQRLQMDSCSV